MIQSIVFHRDAAQSLVYTFSTALSSSVNASTLVLYNLTNRTTLQSSFIGFSDISNTVTFTFPGFAKGMLPDGNYKAILYGERVTDISGTPMAADSTFNFTFYDGDANADNVINALDFNALASNFGKPSPTYSQGDFNFDGSINSQDFTLMAARFGSTFAAPVAAPRVVDVTTFNAAPEGSADYFTQNMFNHLNIPYPGGVFFAMGTDAHRAEVQAQGNSLAVYFNNLTTGIDVNNPNAMIQTIQNNCLTFTTTGVQPTWIVLNEMSSSLWPPDANQSYRDWMKTVVHTLHLTYGHEVILYTPFPNPGAHPADWQRSPRIAISRRRIIKVARRL